MNGVMGFQGMPQNVDGVGHVFKSLTVACVECGHKQAEVAVVLPLLCVV